MSELKPSRLRTWRYALMSTAAYHPVFAQMVYGPVRIRGGEWGDIVWEGIRAR